MGKISFLHTWNQLSPKIRQGFGGYCTNLYGKYSIQNAILALIFEQNPQEEAVEITDFQKLLALKTSIKHSHKNLSNAFSDLHNWLHAYLVNLYLEEQAEEYNLLRLKALSRFGLEKDFGRIERKVEKYIEAQTERNRQYFEAQISLFSAKLSVPWLDHHQSDLDQWMSELNESLDGYYALSKIQLATEKNNRAHIISKTEEIEEVGYLNQMAAQLEAKKGGLYPTIFEDIHTLQSLFSFSINEPPQAESLEVERLIADSYYQKLWNLLTEGKIVHKENQEELCQLLMNHCIRASRYGEKEKYFSQMFDIMCFGLDRHAFTWRGYFHHSTFLNFVAIVIFLKKYDWLEDFISKWGPYLLESHTYVALLSRSFLYFELKKYQETYDLISNIDIKTPYAQTLFKITELKCMYELQHSEESIKAKIDALIKYIQQKWSVQNRKQFVLFPKLMKKLYVKKFTYEKMKTLIQQNPQVGSAAWLLEKAKNLKKK